MQIVDKLDVVYDDYFPEEPSDKEIEETLYDAEAWVSNLSENQRVILTFNEIKQWFDTWDQSKEADKYENVYEYIRDCIGNGFHAVISTEALHYIADLVFNISDGDPTADITEEDAMDFIEAAQEMGYSIPEMLTPKFFVEIYNDFKPDKEEE